MTKLAEVGREIASGALIPVLGPDLLEGTSVPAGARALAHILSSRVAVPGRLRNNLWHAAQYIETSRHRVTLDKLMMDAFHVIPEPGVLHRWLAAQPGVRLIIDTWYDGTLAKALEGRADWGRMQGASKARRRADALWYRAFDHAGTECPAQAALDWALVVYKPHGGAQPAGDVLASDSDYVEVLTEIDIQSPIPDTVKERRNGRGMVFLGCRFYDQILRNFARTFLKNVSGRRFAVLPASELTRNELRFLASESITILDVPLSEAARILAADA